MFRLTSSRIFCLNDVKQFIFNFNCQRVYPSPSKRRMDDKGTEEELTYPNIYFTVDNFEEVINVHFGNPILKFKSMLCYLEIRNVFKLM